MIQAELDAGGEAFMKLATSKGGGGSLVSLDDARGVAAVVLTAAEKVRKATRSAAAPRSESLMRAGSAPSNMAENVGPEPESLAVDTLSHHLRNAERWVKGVATAIVTAGAPKP